MFIAAAFKEADLGDRGAMSFGDPAWQSWILDEDKVGHNTTNIASFLS